jgi:hypothetical protein
MSNFTLDDLNKFLALMAALSVAVERLVEILKTFVFKKLNLTLTDPEQEAMRQGKVQVLALIASLLTSLLLGWLGILPGGWTGALGMGLLASGGSGLWNSLLGWAKGLKDIRQAQGEQARAVEETQPAARNVLNLEPRATGLPS